MKRATPLIELSREHHGALVLAKHARACATNPGDAAALRGHILAKHAAELLEHFSIEERELPGAIVPVAPELILRLFEEHTQLRTLLKRIEAGDLAALSPFGELLAVHVRFEERELFPCFESILTAVA